MLLAKHTMGLLHSISSTISFNKNWELKSKIQVLAFRKMKRLKSIKFLRKSQSFKAVNLIGCIRAQMQTKI